MGEIIYLKDEQESHLLNLLVLLLEKLNLIQKDSLPSVWKELKMKKVLMRKGLKDFVAL